MALGISTFNRPNYLQFTLEAVAKHLDQVVDVTYVHNDGSAAHHREAYWKAYEALPTAVVQHDPVNRGVAKAKNALLREMLADGADWLCLLEDDIAPLSRSAILGYLAACRESGWQHLSFAHHGPLNKEPKEVVGPVTLWPHYVGAFCIYSREALEECGLLDERFANAWEHVEHTLRLARAGYTDPRPWHVADATGSENWLRELPGSIENSSIRPRPDWQENIDAGREYWQEHRSATYEMLFPQ